MSDSKLIVVFGATGKQGGSVVQSLLKRGYKVRGVTRNPDSEASKKLKDQGVEMIKAEQSNPAEVKEAVKGAYGLFALTDFWKPENMGKEVELSKNLGDAAKEAGVKHIVFSDLPNVKEISKGKYNVPHFTDKEEGASQVEKLGFPYFTRVRPPFYFQNFQIFFPPKKEGDTFVFTLPMPQDCFLTSFDVLDMGEPVAGVFDNPEKYNKKIVPVAGEHRHPQEYIQIFEKVTGQKAKYNELTVEQFSKLGFPGAEELGHMFGYFNDYTYFGSKDADPFQYKAELFPNVKSFEQWLKESGWKGQ